MAKKTVAELEAAARQAEQRAKDLRAQAKKLTAKQTAALNADIIKAVDEWRKSYPTPIPREDLPQRFRDWAQKNWDKYNSGGN